MESWFKWLRPKNRAVLGIDITASAVKIVEIRQDISNASFYLQAHAISPDVINSNARVAVLAISDTAVITKTIQIDNDFSLSDPLTPEMDENILLQAYQAMPFSVNEINLDFNILGIANETESKIDVLVVASKTEQINNRMRLAKQVGLNPVIIDVESYAAARSIQYLSKKLPGYTKEKLIILINFDLLFVYYYIFNSINVVFTYNEKHNNHEQLEYILLRIERVLNLFYATRPSGTIMHCFIAGYIEFWPNMAVSVQETCHISTSIANPLDYLQISDNLASELDWQTATKLIIACGLALRAFA